MHTDRRFINDVELEQFLFAARMDTPHRRTLQFLVACTGCHLKESLTLSLGDIDLNGAAVLFFEGKKRARSVPIGDELVQMLDVVHALSFIRNEVPEKLTNSLWDIDRCTASKWIAASMEVANIHGPQASARGLRHGFAIRSLSAGHSTKTVAYWMGLSVEEVTKNYLR